MSENPVSQNQASQGRTTQKDVIVVCGIGNQTRGDDGCGPHVIQKLMSSKDCFDNLDVHLIDCGLAPENFTGKIVALAPRKVIIVDAVDLGDEPGYFEYVDIERIKGQLISTHKLPVTLFISFLQKEAGCDVDFIGIQPKTLGFGDEMSAECVKGCSEVVDMILEIF
ncbi:MAG: hydrogenase 3 maturation endopeptidase HyCI [archaeon]|nr:hydrogenase 3 maturation endopeptidase HyCI [archaeon]